MVWKIRKVVISGYVGGGGVFVRIRVDLGDSLVRFFYL